MPATSRVSSIGGGHPPADTWPRTAGTRFSTDRVQRLTRFRRDGGQGTTTRTFVIGLMKAAPRPARPGEMSTGAALLGVPDGTAWTTISWILAGWTGVRWIMQMSSP